MTAPILILGNGQIGSALKAKLPQAVLATRQELDLATADSTAIEQYIASIHPAALINAAAYTQVDKAESEQQLAFRINEEAVAYLASVCAKRHIPLIHYSTDYVFDGSGNVAWTESDNTAPLNIYGKSKLAGEQAIQQSGCDYIILRTSWVYNETGKNFLTTMLSLGAERTELKIVADQFGAPSYASDIATATVEILDKAMKMSPFPSGIYHLCNGGECSWHEFAKAIFATAQSYASLTVKTILPIPTSEYLTPARRPLNSRLNCDKVEKQFGVRLRAWQEGLKTCMKQRYESHTATATGTRAG